MRASVIIPSFNAAATIAGCLDALVKQTLPAAAYEIIVVDDGSTDETRAVVARFQAVCLLTRVHGGAAAARNAGARLAQSDILLFTDADCEPTPDWIEAMLAPFANPALRVAGVKGVYLTRQRERVARFVQLEYEEKYARMRGRASIDFVDTYSAGYRRDLFLANGGFDESFPAASVEDQEFSFRLAGQGHCLVMAPNARVYHRHVTTVSGYWRRKFRIGYWKVRVHRRHPDKLLGDSHTPPTLLIQVGLVLLLAALLVVTPFAPVAVWGIPVAVVAGLVSAMPLMRLVARRDPTLLGPALGLIAVRAAALGAGLASGALGELFHLLSAIPARLRRHGAG